MENYVGNTVTNAVYFAINIHIIRVEHVHVYVNAKQKMGILKRKGKSF